LTKVSSDTPRDTSTSRETITTFYESAQLDSGKPNTPGSTNKLSNSIPCVSNHPFIMGNQFTKKERDQVSRTFNSLRDSNVSPKLKNNERIRNQGTLPNSQHYKGVEGCAGAPRLD
jgi:hypothetical protein